VGQFLAGVYISSNRGLACLGDQRGNVIENGLDALDVIGLLKFNNDSL